MPQTMTKTEERELLTKTIDALPDSYLRDILITETPAIIRAIDNDLGFIDLAGHERAARQAYHEAMIARKALTETNQQIAQARQQLKDVEREIQNARSAAAAALPDPVRLRAIAEEIDDIRKTYKN